MLIIHAFGFAVVVVAHTIGPEVRAQGFQQVLHYCLYNFLAGSIEMDITDQVVPIRQLRANAGDGVNRENEVDVAEYSICQFAMCLGSPTKRLLAYRTANGYPKILSGGNQDYLLRAHRLL